MKVVIVSDIHANFAALRSLTETWDELWVMGDLVNYGPNPREVIDWVQDHAHVVIRGNHDHAVGFATDPRCSAPYKEMASQTGAYTHSILKGKERSYLARLPLSAERRLEKHTFYLCHATPSDPLFGYKDMNDPGWNDEVESTSADVVVVGHTHIPFIRRIGTHQLVNPGSIGQPKTGSADACYAVWEDGRLRLERYAYSIGETLDGIRSMPITEDVKDDLTYVLQSGGRSRRGGQ